ncbi:HRDC domain-containing protein [Deinococcus gobiensis]|uniref:HRDC domain-containing protein n=1 Tax=Deinococcus gobiensis TaxID=502394 RepID=UPI001D03FAD1
MPPPPSRARAKNTAILDRLRGSPLAASPLLAAEAGPPPNPDAAPQVAEALRELRRELSRESGHSAYVVYPNSALEALAQAQPRTLGALRGVPGLGEKRIAAYGERIVNAVNTALGD